MLNRFQKLSQYSRISLWLSYVGLVAVITWGTLVQPSCHREPNVVIWAIQILLLLAFLPGLLKQNLRSLVWLSFIILGFFIAAVSTAFACTSLVAILEVVFIVVLFIAAMLHIRWHSKAQKENDVAVDTQD